MNGRKFFFFDIDGTLTTPLTNDYPDSTREAIKELQDNGHFVAIATGRMQADAWEVAKALGICAAVSDGGNALTIHGELIYDEGLPLEDCIRRFRKSTVRDFLLLSARKIRKCVWRLRTCTSPA